MLTNSSGAVSSRRNHALFSFVLSIVSFFAFSVCIVVPPIILHSLEKRYPIVSGIDHDLLFTVTGV